MVVAIRVVVNIVFALVGAVACSVLGQVAGRLIDAWLGVSAVATEAARPTYQHVWGGAGTLLGITAGILVAGWVLKTNTDKPSEPSEP